MTGPSSSPRGEHTPRPTAPPAREVAPGVYLAGEARDRIADRAAPDSQLGRIHAYVTGRLSDHTARDRIADALYERERVPGDPAWEHAYAADREVFEAMADAVLPVLPAIRAAGLRWAADELGRMDYDTDSTDYGYGPLAMRVWDPIRQWKRSHAADAQSPRPGAANAIWARAGHRTNSHQGQPLSHVRSRPASRHTPWTRRTIMDPMDPTSRQRCTAKSKLPGTHKTLENQEGAS